MNNAAYNTLQKISYFRDLKASTIDRINRELITRRVHAGEMVFAEGEPCEGLFIVECGWLKAVKLSPSGREQVIRTVGPGDSFNEMGVFASGVNHVTIIALEDATIHIIRRDLLLCLVREDAELGAIIIQNMSERLIHLMNLVEDLSLRKVEQRLARLLLRQTDISNEVQRNWQTQSELASQIGTVVDVLNRVLRGFVEDHLIQVERGRIQILDRKGLESRSNQN
jgi:CRP-like cAMP-binding protein